MTPPDRKNPDRVKGISFPISAARRLSVAVALAVFLTGGQVAAGEGQWNLGDPVAEENSPGSTSLHIHNYGKAALNVQVIWSGGLWSARIPPDGERTVNLKQAGAVDYILKAGTESTEGTLQVDAERQTHWRVAYTGEVDDSPRPQPIDQAGETVQLFLPADEFADFDRLSTPDKIELLEKALAGDHRGNADIIRALSVLHNNHALSLQKQRNWDQALSHFRRAIDLAPDDLGIRRNLTISRHNRALALLESGDFRAADREMTAALAESPSPDLKASLNSSYAEILLQWGIDEDEKGWHDSAARRYQQAIALDPGSAVAWARLGEIHYTRHALAEAEECFRQAVQILPREDLQRRLAQIQREIAVSADFATSDAGKFRIYFEGGENAALARQVRAILRQAYRDVGRLFRHYPREELPVVIYNSAQFGHVTQLHAMAGAAYDGKIRLRIDPQEKLDREILLPKLKTQIYHEYAHAVIHSLAGPGVPGWLHEGLAQYAEKPRPLPAEERELISGHLRRGSLPPVDQLTPSLIGMGDAERVSLAYLAAKGFVHYLARRHGMRHFRTLLSQMGAGKTLENSVQAAFGRSLRQLELDWHASLI